MSHPTFSPPIRQVVGRLAPSPTGAQHVGNARTYLIAWLSARAQGGRIVLRIEDIDSPRIKPGAAEQACDDLRWLGLDWEGPIVQAQRLPLYEGALQRLQEQELVYPCTCTRSDVERAASAPHAEHEGAIYPGTCAGRRAGDAAALAGQPYAWRFRADKAASTFEDGFRGPTCVPAEMLGDFVVDAAAVATLRRPEPAPTHFYPRAAGGRSRRAAPGETTRRYAPRQPADRGRERRALARPAGLVVRLAAAHRAGHRSRATATVPPGDPASGAAGARSAAFASNRLRIGG